MFVSAQLCVCVCVCVFVFVRVCVYGMVYVFKVSLCLKGRVKEVEMCGSDQEKGVCR
jgi:hypothetical protein